MRAVRFLTVEQRVIHRTLSGNVHRIQVDRINGDSGFGGCARNGLQHLFGAGIEQRVQREVDDGFSLAHLLLESHQGKDPGQRTVRVLVLHNQLRIFESLQGGLRLGPLLHVHMAARGVHAGAGDGDEILFRGPGSQDSLWFRFVLSDVYALAES